MLKVNKEIGFYCLNNNSERKEWMVVYSFPPESGAPLGGFAIYVARRLTPEVMGERRTFNENEVLLKRRLLTHITSIGPGSATALLHALSLAVESAVSR